MTFRSVSRALAACAGACLVVALCPLIAEAAPSGAALFAERAGVKEFTGRLTVRVRPGLPAARDAAARARLAPITLTRYAETDEYIVMAPVEEGVVAVRGRGENRLGAQLIASGDYQYVHPDWLCYPQAMNSNDPGLGQQWHQAKIRTPEAWDISTGAPGVIVAVVDTGIDVTHPDLAPRRVSGYNAVNHLAESAGGMISDVNGHGTHVAGCAAAAGNNGVGVSGIGWSLSIMMIRASNVASGAAFQSDLLDGARWAANHGARVVSISFGGVDDETVQETGAFLKTKNALLCYAADNSNTDYFYVDWPDVLVVGATTPGDQKAWFSSYGAVVDVFAPGTAIYSTARWGQYESRDGTSQATPLVAGLAGLIWSVSPSFTPAQVETFIESTCADLGAPGNDSVFGWGRVDAFEAVKKAKGATGQYPPTAQPDTGAATAGIPTLIDVLANDYDVNGDAIDLSSLVIDSTARGGTITRSKGSGPGGRDQIVYTAPGNISGTDSFTYIVLDSTRRSSKGSVSVQVTPRCLADVNGDGFVNGDDSDLFEAWFASGDKRADLNRNGFVNGDDFDVFVGAFAAGC